MITKHKISSIWKILENVKDPEVPVLTVVDLGIIRDIRYHNDELEVVITPTYSGCPAMNTIATNIKLELAANGFEKFKVTTILSPAWTTDWLSEEGKKKLKAYGIAPPVKETLDKSVLFGEQPEVECPQCASTQTKLISQFGSTACKALYQCQTCKEPFDYFKCH
ncbi:MAG: 1,2-phenylacetyl-CoA epoxidase subunit PaaD [Bacteroidota bacterium]